MKNELVKRPNQVEEWTNEQLIEFQKCASDPIYFMKTYMKVMHPTRGAIPFILYDYQEEAINSFLSKKDVIMMCGRQQGKCLFPSTIINTGTKPTGFKKFLLRIFFKKQYEKIFL
jgi:hypothetical protein